jgi:hypothetical protein
MSAFVYVKPAASMSLTEFSELFAGLFPVTDLHERESSNYYRGYYYSGRLEERKIKLCYSDEEDGDKYPFWIVVTRKEGFVGEDDTRHLLVAKLAREIAARGHSTLIPDDERKEKRA